MIESIIIAEFWKPDLQDFILVLLKGLFPGISVEAVFEKGMEELVQRVLLSVEMERLHRILLVLLRRGVQQGITTSLHEANLESGADKAQRYNSMIVSHSQKQYDISEAVRQSPTTTMPPSTHIHVGSFRSSPSTGPMFSHPVSLSNRAETCQLTVRINELLASNERLTHSLFEAKAGCDHWKMMYAKILNKGSPSAEEMLKKLDAMDSEKEALQIAIEKERETSETLRKQTVRQGEELEALFGEINKNKLLYEDLIGTIQRTADTRVNAFLELLSKIAHSLSVPFDGNAEYLLVSRAEELRANCDWLQTENNRLCREKEECEELLCNQEEDEEEERSGKVRQLQTRISKMEEELSGRVSLDEERRHQLEAMKLMVSELQDELRRDKCERAVALAAEETLPQTIPLENEVSQEEVALLHQRNRDPSVKKIAIEAEIMELGEHVRKLNEDIEQRRVDFDTLCEQMCTRFVLFAFEIERLHLVKDELISSVKSGGEQNKVLQAQLYLNETENVRLTEARQSLVAKTEKLEFDLIAMRERCEMRNSLYDDVQLNLLAQNELHVKQLELLDTESFVAEFLMGVELERLSLVHKETLLELQSVERDDAALRRRHTETPNVMPKSSPEKREFRSPEPSSEKREHAMRSCLVVDGKLKHLQESLQSFEKSLLQTNRQKYSSFK